MHIIDVLVTHFSLCLSRGGLVNLTQVVMELSLYKCARKMEIPAQKILSNTWWLLLLQPRNMYQGLFLTFFPYFLSVEWFLTGSNYFLNLSSVGWKCDFFTRFLLRVLPVEVSSYTSEEEIKRAIKPIIDKYFPEESQVPRKVYVATFSFFLKD